MIYCADVSTFKNLTAAAYGKRLGISFVVGFRTVIAHHFEVKHFVFIYVRGEEHSFSVWINTANILAVYFYTDFRSSFKAEPELFTL